MAVNDVAMGLGGAEGVGTGEVGDVWAGAVVVDGGGGA